jgi:hypothetical protein
MLLLLSLLITPLSGAFQGPHRQHNRFLLSGIRRRYRIKAAATKRLALSEETFLDGDLVAILPHPYCQSDTASPPRPRLCVVRSEGIVLPREYDNVHWWTTRQDDDVIGRYGEGFYGQRPVPSLGGGPGYGAPANEISPTHDGVKSTVWSVFDRPNAAEPYKHRHGQRRLHAGRAPQYQQHQRTSAVEKRKKREPSKFGIFFFHPSDTNTLHHCPEDRPLAC